ncbi:hypothetical protein ACFX2A_006725 [Malus domestica]
MGEKRRRTKSFKTRRKPAAGKTSPASQGGRRCAWGARGPVPPRARGTSKKFSKNFATSVTSSDTYPEDERIQGRHVGYDPSTYQ